MRVFTYVRVPLGTPVAVWRAWRRALVLAGERGGHEIAGHFLEQNPAQPVSAFLELAAAAKAARRRGEAVGAVLVPAAIHLGPTPRVQTVMAQRFAREAGVRVLLLRAAGEGGRVGAGESRPRLSTPLRIGPAPTGRPRAGP